MSDLILGIVIGYILCWLFGKIALWMFFRALDKAKDERDLLPKQIQARVEEFNGVFLLYNCDTEEFLGQGTDHDTLKDNVSARWKEFDVAIVAGDVSHIRFLKEQKNASSNNQ